jgi:hypothetical protein
MKRALPVLLSVTLIALTLAPTARALGSPGHSRPPGLAASDWVPISNDLAAVIEEQAADPIGTPGASYWRAQPAVLGYFVAWRGGRWVRLDSLVQQLMPRRAPGAASTWMPIARNLAFVIEQQTPGQLMRSQPTPSALGYFVINRGGHWLQLQPIAAGALFRGPLASRPASKWVPINSSLRFIIEQQMPQRYVSGKLPSVLGYFIGKRAGRWIRLSSTA